MRPGKFLGRCPVNCGTETKGDEIPYSSRSLCVSRSNCTHCKEIIKILQREGGKKEERDGKGEERREEGRALSENQSFTQQTWVRKASFCCFVRGYFIWFCLVFRQGLTMYVAHSPGTWYAEQVLTHKDPPASVFLVLSLQAYTIIASCSSVAAVADTNIYPIWKHSAPGTRWLEALELVRFLSSSPQHCPAIPNTRGLSCQRQGATVLWTQDLIVFRLCYLLFSHSVTSCQMLPHLSGWVL